MNQEVLFLPVFALVALTFAVGFWMAGLRFKVVKKGDLPVKYFQLNRGAEPPEYLVKVSRNFQNLLETPILFYVVLLMIYATRRVDDAYVALAWVYVGTRVVHSFIHTTYNNVHHRLMAFLSGVLLIILLWVRLFFQIL